MYNLSENVMNNPATQLTTENNIFDIVDKFLETKFSLKKKKIDSKPIDPFILINTRGSCKAYRISCNYLE